jgi:hypothetical protein
LSGVASGERVGHWTLAGEEINLVAARHHGSQLMRAGLV